MSANASSVAQVIDLDTATLRKAIQDEYREVAEHPDKGFHFHTGRRLTQIVGYKDEWLTGVSERAIETFAGTGNPFAMGEVREGGRLQIADILVSRAVPEAAKKKIDLWTG